MLTSRSFNGRHDLDLVALVQQAQLRVGDVLCYRRRFPALGVLVEKDLLVRVQV